MGLFDRLRKKPEPVRSVNTRQEVRERMQAAAMVNTGWVNPIGQYTGEKYGSINYSNFSGYNYTTLRRNSRGVYNESTIATGIITRFADNVINTGLTWESAPLWNLLPDAPKEDQARYEWTQTVESMWKLYAESKEADIEGVQTFNQLQRKLYRLEMIDGEIFGIIRYLKTPSRMSPVALQLIKPEQVINPTSHEETKAIENRGGSVKHGIEKDSIGKVVAIHVRDADTMKTKRIPIFSTKSGRHFVIHSGNFEAVGQLRGLPELSKLVYELSRLTEYDIAELEAVVANALFLASVEADVNATPKKPGFAPKTANPETNDYVPKTGIETVQVGKRALVLNNLPPGYKMNFHQMTRPNQNYSAFVEAFMTRIAGCLGMPLSVLTQKFNASYSAARAEILFFWNTVNRRRADFVSGFLSPFYEAWFTEQIKAGDIKSPGYDRPLLRRAWLHGVWTGISRPVVDPLKEVKAVETRIRLGHTTGEREAKAYNGSDYRENVERLKTENKSLAESRKPLEKEKQETKQ